MTRRTRASPVREGSICSYFQLDSRVLTRKVHLLMPARLARGLCFGAGTTLPLPSRRLALRTRARTFTGNHRFLGHPPLADAHPPRPTPPPIPLCYDVIISTSGFPSPSRSLFLFSYWSYCSTPCSADGDGFGPASICFRFPFFPARGTD